MIAIEKASVFAEGLDHPECVAVHPDGSVWAGGEAGQLYRISKDGSTVDEVANTRGFVLGIAFSPGAHWLAVCDLANHCVWRLDPATGDLRKLFDKVDGEPLKIPNYICFRENGGFFLSDSGDFRQTNGKIYSVDAEGEPTIWHAGPFNFANGIALFDDWLYIVCSFLPGIERVQILHDGSAGKREMYCTLPETVPDGVAFDTSGNLYVSCYAPNRIYRVTPDRASAIWIDDWEAHTLSNPTNIAFGGTDHNQIFASNLGRWHITRIDSGAQGMLLPSHKH